MGSDFDEPTHLSMSSPYSLASREPTRPLPPSPPAALPSSFSKPASANPSGVRPARAPGVDDTVTMPRILWDPEGVQTVVRTQPKAKSKRRRRRASRDALALTAAKSSLAGLAFATGIAVLVALIAIFGLM